MFKSANSAVARAVEGSSWKKFAHPTVARGKTVFPKAPQLLTQLGVRWDYDGAVQRPDGTYHKYQMQPNAGKIPSSVKQWRDKNGGTHAVMTTVFIKEGSSQEEVRSKLQEAIESIRGA